MMSVTHLEYRLYSPRIPLTTIACGQSFFACFIGMAEWMPNFRASLYTIFFSSGVRHTGWTFQKDRHPQELFHIDFLSNHSWSQPSTSPNLLFVLSFVLPIFFPNRIF